MKNDQSNKDVSNTRPSFGRQELKTAIILAGGFGTRLREALPDLPKSMATVDGRPFLFYLINYLRSQGIEKFIFSLGYKYEIVTSYLESQFPALDYNCSVEKEPLGTGGAILASCYLSPDKTVLVVNGDTLFKIDLEKAWQEHTKFNSDCTLLLKPMKDFDRYGVVELNEDSSIKSFKEKQFYNEGLINGGIYILNAEQFIAEELPDKFSFEKEYLEKYFDTRRIYGTVQDGYFIDIGIPADYNKAQKDLKQKTLDLRSIDPGWTLFLDRDGVINHEKKDDYIRNRQEFIFYEDVKEAMKVFANKFGRIIVVSNQRGVGKGLMTEDDVIDIHAHMKEQVEHSGGRIDDIYFCTAVTSKDPYRKPNPGMAFSAKRDHPDIDLSKSIVAGNKPSDMLFGKNAGMYSVFIASTHPETAFPHPDIDLRFNSLIEFAKACQSAVSPLNKKL